MKSFLNRSRPVLTTMINNASTPDRVLYLIRKGVEANTDAFGLQIEQLEAKYRTREIFSEFFAAMEGRPAYITNYRRCGLCPDLSDEELTEQMLTAMDCGAVLFDMRGDLFCPSPLEITYDEAAIEKQKKLVKTIHEMGGEVLMSSHVLQYMPSDEVLSLSFAHAERGADISKIVTDASTDEQLTDTFKASVLLKEQSKIKTLLLCNGTKSRSHRIIGPALGSCMFLNVCGDETYNGSQPELRDAVKLLELCGI